jgi:hypothetical protein
MAGAPPSPQADNRRNDGSGLDFWLLDKLFGR